MDVSTTLAKIGDWSALINNGTTSALGTSCWNEKVEDGAGNRCAKEDGDNEGKYAVDTQGFYLLHIIYH